MNRDLRKDADTLIKEVLTEIKISSVLKEKLNNYPYPKGKLYVLAIGKAAYEMAKAADGSLKIDKGFVLTKYGHSKDDLKQFVIYEAAHPLTDESGISASKTIVRALLDLKENDEVLLLLSGGGSALFEIPVISPDELRDINDQLLKSGASIDEINTIRKRLSLVKGGRLAQIISPAHIRELIISDVVSNRLDVIASGPAYPDLSTSAEAFEIAEKYQLSLSTEALEAISKETPKTLANIDVEIISSVSELAQAAKSTLQKMGYDPLILNDHYEGDAEETAKYITKKIEISSHNALILTGETTVKLRGNGLGGRNQHLALCAAQYLKNKDIAIISLGSDGTDGPTDAAGGYADGDTVAEIERNSDKDISYYIENNDAYHALEITKGLIITGPTGTNINDLIIILKK